MQLFDDRDDEDDGNKSDDDVDNKQTNLCRPTINKNNELMLHKQKSNEEKAWYGFHIHTEKASMKGNNIISL